MKSPTLTSPSSPTGACRETGCCAILSSAWMRETGMCISSASSSGMGSRPNSCVSCFCARQSLFMIEIMNKLWRAQKQLTQELGREPMPEELADEMHMPVSRIHALLKMAQQPVSLHAPVGDDGDVSVGDFIEDKSAENPSEVTSYSLLREKLSDVLTTLTERERKILEMRFGLLDGYERTLEEIGKMYNVTRERIRQIEAKALRKLRHPTRVRHLQGFLDTEEEAAA